MSPRARSPLGIAAVAAALALAACGGSSRPAGSSTAGRYPVAVHARFPRVQRLAQRARLVIAVRNTGTRTIPDVAVSICNASCAAGAPAGQGTDAGPFAADVTGTDLANPSRPLWIVDRGPGACGYSCANDGPGAGVTANANTWALGRLAPGHTVRFAWAVTPVTAGRHVVAWQVAGDLSGRARATLAGGAIPAGRFAVHVSGRPLSTRVTPSGRVVATRG